MGGEVLATSSQPHASVEPRPGYREHNPCDWWDAACICTRKVLDAAPGASVRGVGITGFIASLTFLDSEGSPVRPSIGFQDQRALEEMNLLYHTFTRAELATMLAIDLPPAPSWPLPRLLWMRRHEPKLLERTRYLLQSKDYINLQLTGEFASDASSNRGLVDFAVNRPATDVLTRLNLPDLLPPLFPPEQVIGTVTPKAALKIGLRAGLPVIAGWNDLNACVLGSGAIEDGQAFDVTGTSEHIGIVTSQHFATKELMCAPYLAGKKLLYGVISSGGGAFQWFSRFSGKSIDELLALHPESANGLLFLPYLEGERSPIWDAQASGVLLGLRSTHKESDVARAVLEGVAFSLRQNLNLVEEQASYKPDTVVASGGASRIELWNQIKADVLGKDVVALRNPQAGIQGAAILAAVAIGQYPNPEAASVAMVQTAKRVQSRPQNRQHLNNMFALYERVYPALHETLTQLRQETLN